MSRKITALQLRQQQELAEVSQHSGLVELEDTIIKSSSKKLGDFRMLNLKRKATLFANSYHKLQLVGINNITAGGKEQRTIPILIESHFICAYRLVSIALPYNTNSQEFSESGEQRHSNAQGRQ